MPFSHTESMVKKLLIQGVCSLETDVVVANALNRFLFWVIEKGMGCLEIYCFVGYENPQLIKILEQASHGSLKPGPVL